MQPLPSQVAMLQLAAQHAGARALVIDASWRTAQPIDTAAIVRAATQALAEVEAAGVGAIIGDGVRFVPADRAPVTVEDFASGDAYRAWRGEGTLLLDGGPLVRVAVVTLGTDHCVRVLAHHAVLDGFAVTRLFRRIVERLDAEAAGAPLPYARCGDLAALAAAAPSLRPPDPLFWSAATEDLGAPGHEIAFTVRPAPPADHPLQHRVTFSAPTAVHRRSWPGEAAAVVAAYTARHLGTETASVGVIANLRRTDLERATPVQWMAAVPTRLDVPADATPAALAADLYRWLGAAAERIATGERPEQLATAVPAAWRAGRLFGPIVNILPDVGVPGWTLDVAAWGPVSDCLFSVHPVGEGEFVVDGVFHPDLYDAAGAAAHVQAVAGALAAALAAPDEPLPPIPARAVDPDRVAVPGGWIVPGRVRAALAAAGFPDERVELLTEAPVTVVLRGVEPEELPRARAVLPPGVRVRRA
ncbi:hypothetical protein FK268_05275 [Tsukamurella sputi]|uniref:Condensation domain-containing protein n=1 Tax=Tsukamurella sputi TaxID=2591848 RepID=A0A5C5RQ68_9ACTN|nr:hypothetical protein [Tsukamurella sputi]TWS24663.1 hypothetical protein FK268_05275 [Tsukamurella sputi]